MAQREAQPDRPVLRLSRPADRDRPDGVKELVSLDLFEVTLTSVPANADARVLSTKSAERPEADFLLSDTEIRLRAKQIEAEQKASRPIRIASFEC